LDARKNGGVQFLIEPRSVTISVERVIRDVEPELLHILLVLCILVVLYFRKLQRGACQVDSIRVLDESGQEKVTATSTLGEDFAGLATSTVGFATPICSAFGL
jgi:hypothetical protein